MNPAENGSGFPAEDETLWVPAEALPSAAYPGRQPDGTRFGNVLFLDVDGVLCTDWSFRLNRLLRRPVERELFDPLSLWWLRRLVRRTGAAVVLSSSWRDGLTIDDPFCRTMTERLFTVLARNGTPFADATPLCTRGDKGTEIAAWLERFPCERYAILDDHNCFTLRPEVEAHWIPIPNSRGLRGPEARAAVKAFQEA